MPATYTSMQVDAAGAAFHAVEREAPAPAAGHVRVAVEACGVCHSDALFTAGHMPGVAFPLVVGHEIAGRVDALGPGVAGVAVGQRVAVGWFGGNCGHCAPCREGDAINCVALQVPGLSYPGGYAEEVVVPASALARIPDGLGAAEAAPLGCAGVTAFNALRRSAARPGALVAVLGLGGLGHLGVQFAARMGFETVAIARGADKRALAEQLGAHHYIDNQAEDAAAALRALGGAAAVLATAPDNAAMLDTLGGLAPRGELVVVGVNPASVPFNPSALIGGTKRVYGHASGTSIEVEETMRFAALTGVRPMVEQVPLDRVGDAFDRMLSGRARFRMVLTTRR